MEARISPFILRLPGALYSRNRRDRSKICGLYLHEIFHINRPLSLCRGTSRKLENTSGAAEPRLFKPILGLDSYLHHYIICTE